jgi:hypothetical protein
MPFKLRHGMKMQRPAENGKIFWFQEKSANYIVDRKSKKL